MKIAETMNSSSQNILQMKFNQIRTVCICKGKIQQGNGMENIETDPNIDRNLVHDKVDM